MTKKVVPIQVVSYNASLVFLMSNGQVLRYTGASWSKIEIPEDLIEQPADNDMLTEA